MVALTASSQDQASVGAEVSIAEMGIVVSPVQQIDFGNFTFTANDTGGAVKMNLNTGAIAANESTYISTGSSQTGMMTLSMPAQSTYTVKCDDDAYLARQGGSDLSIRIAVSRVYFNVDGGNIRTCGQSVEPLSYNSPDGSDTLKVGAWINLNSGSDTLPGDYSTEYTTGKPVTLTFTLI